MDLVSWSLTADRPMTLWTRNPKGKIPSGEPHHLTYPVGRGWGLPTVCLGGIAIHGAEQCGPGLGPRSTAAAQVR